MCKRENPGRVFLLRIDAERCTKGMGLRNTVMSGGLAPSATDAVLMAQHLNRAEKNGVCIVCD